MSERASSESLTTAARLPRPQIPTLGVSRRRTMPWNAPYFNIMPLLSHLGTFGGRGGGNFPHHLQAATRILHALCLSRHDPSSHNDGTFEVAIS